MKRKHLKSLLSAVFCGFYAFCATAASSIFSDYGQIQNVQNYSTNPFWTPNSPYNQRLPQPVYVQGADLNADDCFKVVQSLVSVQCMARDNCKNTSLAEIRPTIMVQLSNLPGNNYVSACSGFIDGVFESYVAQYGNSVPNRAVAFPVATGPNQNLNNNNTIKIENPYKQETPKWKQEIIDRGKELKQLQQQNGAGGEHLSATAFPTTYNDLSFSERVSIKAEDYEQYKDMNAYVVPNFVNQKEWCNGEGKGSQACGGNTTTTSSTTTNTTNANSNNTPNKPITTCDEGQQIPAHALESKKDGNGACIVEKCEPGWQPNADKTACIDTSTYYTLAFCWTGNEEETNYDKYYCEQSHYSTNKCFPVCGQPTTYNGPIGAAIKDLFDSSKTYCVPRILDGSSYYKDAIDKFSLVDYDTREPLRFEGKRKAEDVAERMFAESDEISANQGSSKPCDGYNKNIDAIILLHDKGSVKIDSIIRIDD